MDSDSVKKDIMRQALQATNMSNARILIENINKTCFDCCVSKPGSSLPGGEQTCLTLCMDKYMKAWNEVNSAYIRRVQQELSNQTISNA
ncbi:Tim10/DDP family zinc finger-domain-containing protein [Achaetomium macrosporum]|uniref:Mitochondrial import inner membrane translocase subunit n=1 Tax=Achaetomium macrosporum TaxID=79813 RepID=A0AAN7HHJ4_9PEZI|nr:Tim10/DDP family zinc finger-domain-containing protein [Achaetomium macrosporum]